MNLLCEHCGSPSGTKLVCDLCLKAVLASPYLRKKYDRKLQQLGCAAAGYICSYCGGDYSWQDPEDPKRTKRNLVCMDHIKTKGAWPRLRYDFSNLRCTCGAGGKDCHTRRDAGHLSATASTEENIQMTIQKADRTKRLRCSYHRCQLLPTASGAWPDRCGNHPKDRFS